MERGKRDKRTNKKKNRLLSDGGAGVSEMWRYRYSFATIKYNLLAINCLLIPCPNRQNEFLIRLFVQKNNDKSNRKTKIANYKQLKLNRAGEIKKLRHTFIHLFHWALQAVCARHTKTQTHFVVT